MDRQLAERMVGAACLLAVLVLVVPAILDGNPDSGATLTHPEVGESLDLRTHTIRLDSAEREPPVPMPVQARPGPETPVPARDTPGDPPGMAPAGSTAEPPDAPTVGHSGADGAPPDKPKAKSPKQPPVVVATPPGASGETPRSSGGGDWFVQLGSFSQRDNAERLAADLERKGFASSVLAGGGASGKLFRVRSGPAADKPAAEALAARLAAAGFKGGRVGRK